MKLHYFWESITWAIFILFMVLKKQKWRFGLFSAEWDLNHSILQNQQTSVYLSPKHQKMLLIPKSELITKEPSKSLQQTMIALMIMIMLQANVPYKGYLDNCLIWLPIHRSKQTNRIGINWAQKSSAQILVSLCFLGNQTTPITGNIV